MTLDSTLLAILACPEDKRPLYYIESESVLYNPRLKRTYEVRDGIPGDARRGGDRADRRRERPPLRPWSATLRSRPRSIEKQLVIVSRQSRHDEWVTIAARERVPTSSAGRGACRHRHRPRRRRHRGRFLGLVRRGGRTVAALGQREVGAGGEYHAAHAERASSTPATRPGRRARSAASRTTRHRRHLRRADRGPRRAAGVRRQQP